MRKKERKQQLVPVAATNTLTTEAIEQVVMQGDLTPLTTEQRLNYYKSVCESLKLNPLTKPFDYITLNGRLTLYARKDCTEQLRKRDGVSISIISRELTGDYFIVTARATLPNGRVDESLGVVALGKLTGELRANGMMKAETKAKRRVTLSISGLGFFDESEIEDISPDVPGYEREAPTREAEERVKQATANALEERGETVEETAIKELMVDDDVNESNYKDVVSHIGKAEGPLIGRRVGDLNHHIIEWFRDNPDKMPGDIDASDRRLRKALEIAISKLTTNKKAAQTHEDRPDKALEQPVTQSSGLSEIDEKNVTERAPVEETTPAIEVIDWRSITVDAPIKSKVQGKALGEIDESLLKAMRAAIIDKVDWANATTEQKRFRAAYEIAVTELGLFLTKDELVTALLDRADNLVLTEHQLCKHLQAEGLIEHENQLVDISVDMLRYLYKAANWQILKDVIEEKLKPTLKTNDTKNKGSKKKGSKLVQEELI